jgi:dTDP-4-dehydrorhamnose 3,5-epimerase
MERLDGRLSGPFLIRPRVFGDPRGFFAETFRTDALAALGVEESFVQDNHSRSRRGVVRGMHFSVDPGAAKLVRCGRGEIWDVIVDLRRASPTYAHWEAHTLDDEDLAMLYVPAGFAHGFCVLSEVADVLCRQSEYYNPARERAFAHDDPDVGIDWPLPPGERVLSDRDRDAPPLSALALDF